MRGRFLQLISLKNGPSHIRNSYFSSLECSPSTIVTRIRYLWAVHASSMFHLKCEGKQNKSLLRGRPSTVCCYMLSVSHFLAQHWSSPLKEREKIWTNYMTKWTTVRGNWVPLMGLCCSAYIFAKHTLYIFRAELAHPMEVLFVTFAHSEKIPLG